MVMERLGIEQQKKPLSSEALHISMNLEQLSMKEIHCQFTLL